MQFKIKNKLFLPVNEIYSYNYLMSDYSMKRINNCTSNVIIYFLLKKYFPIIKFNNKFFIENNMSKANFFTNYITMMV